MQQKFEELFTKYDKTGKGGLSLWELLEMTAAVRKIMDPFGWSAAQFEWLSTYYVCHNKACPALCASMLHFGAGFQMWCCRAIPQNLV